MTRYSLRLALVGLLASTVIGCGRAPRDGITDLQLPGRAPECAGVTPIVGWRYGCTAAVCERVTRDLAATPAPPAELGTKLKSLCLDPPGDAWSPTHPCADLVCRSLGRHDPYKAVTALETHPTRSVRTAIIKGLEDGGSLASTLERHTRTRLWSELALETHGQEELWPLVRREVARNPDAPGLARVVRRYLDTHRAEVIQIGFDFLRSDHPYRNTLGEALLGAAGISYAEALPYLGSLAARCEHKSLIPQGVLDRLCASRGASASTSPSHPSQENP